MFFLKGIKSQIASFYSEKLLQKTDAILIVSSGRTGTKFFEYFFNEIDPTSIVFHEPKPDFFNLSIRKLRSKLDSNLVTEEMIKHRSSLIAKEKKRLGLKKITYIESNPFLFPLLKEYSSVFKSVKIIYITRDPKTYLISAYNKDPQNDKVNNFYGPSDRRKRLTAVDYNELTQVEWDSLNRAEKIAWYWNKSNEILFSFYSKHKDNSILVRYEDLFSSSLKSKMETLNKILTLTHPNYNVSENEERLLSILDRRLNKSKQLSDKESFQDFNETSKMKIEKIVSPMTKKLGY